MHLDAGIPDTIKGILANKVVVRDAIANPTSEIAERIIEAADKVRSNTVGDAVHLRALIEFSNMCRRNCSYCGIRRDNKGLHRYRMTEGEIIQTAEEAASLGYKTVVLQSGEDPFFTGPRLAGIIEEIKTFGLVVTLSVGEHTPKDYYLWRSAGAERFLLRHETSNPDLYETLHPGAKLDTRLSSLRALKDLEYQVGTGFMVGLPGQTPEILLEDVRLAYELDAEMVGLGPFIPHPDTPLGNSPRGTLEQTRLMLALTRLALPYSLLPSTTALGTINPRGMEAGLQSGANVVMINMTPNRYRSKYQLYPNKARLEESRINKNEIIERIQNLGRTIATDPGHNQKWLKRK